MKEVNKFFGLKEGEIQVCNGWKFECTKVDKDLAKKLDSAPCLFGTLTSPTGEVTEYIVKHVFASKLNKIAGVSFSSSITSKVVNSQTKGENKVISATLSASKQKKRFIKAWRAMLQVHRVYCPEATDIPAVMWEALTAEDSWFNHVEQEKQKQAIEQAKAEAEAKAKAEAAAKKLQDAIIALRRIKEDYINCGMSPEQAETFARQHKSYTDEEKAAAFE